MHLLATSAVLSLFLSFGPAQATREAPLGIEGARHLLLRTGCAGTPQELDRFSKLSREDAVRTLLSEIHTEAITAPPEWVANYPEEVKPRRGMSEEERRALRKRQRSMGQELKKWWYQELATTSSPFTEKMTLFWHNHFTSSLRKVKQPLLMYRQNELLRRSAFGNFKALTQSIARDPAMLVYLDTVSSNRGKPNENFARELMELFTLGEGHYSERDIKEAARAFTGWKVNRRNGTSQLVRRRHDFGQKVFFGRKGNFTGDQVIDMIFEKPQVSVFLTEKLWREFIGGTPDPAEGKRLATLFRASGYEIKPLVEAILLSEFFWKPENRGTLIKSPVELIVGLIRSFELPIEGRENINRLGRGLQQDLFDPPNVKGWPGGEYWITSSTLLLRQQLLERVGLPVRDRGRSMMGRAPAAQKLDHWFASLGKTSEERTVAAVARLCAVPPVDPVEPSSSARAVLRQILLDPTYQLK